jgi:cell division protein FtsB
MKSFVNWCRRFIRIPALIVFLILVYLMFFQENSIQKLTSYRNTIDSLEREIAVNTDTMEYYRALNQRMDNRDPEIIEKIVREHHNMNLPGEDVYVFNQPTK